MNMFQKKYLFILVKFILHLTADGDGICSKTWHKVGKSCIKFSEYHKTMESAIRDCQKMDSTILSIQDSDMWEDFNSAYAKSHSGKSLRINVTSCNIHKCPLLDSKYFTWKKNSRQFTLHKCYYIQKESKQENFQLLEEGCYNSRNYACQKHNKGAIIELTSPSTRKKDTENSNPRINSTANSLQESVDDNSLIIVVTSALLGVFLVALFVTVVVVLSCRKKGERASVKNVSDEKVEQTIESKDASGDSRCVTEEGLVYITVAHANNAMKTKLNKTNSDHDDGNVTTETLNDKGRYTTEEGLVYVTVAHAEKSKKSQATCGTNPSNSPCTEKSTICLDAVEYACEIVDQDMFSLDLKRRDSLKGRRRITQKSSM